MGPGCKSGASNASVRAPQVLAREQGIAIIASICTDGDRAPHKHDRAHHAPRRVRSSKDLPTHRVLNLACTYSSSTGESILSYHSLVLLIAAPLSSPHQTKWQVSPQLKDKRQEGCGRVKPHCPPPIPLTFSCSHSYPLSPATTSSLCNCPSFIFSHVPLHRFLFPPPGQSHLCSCVPRAIQGHCMH